MATKRLFIATFLDSSLFEFIYPEIKEDFEPVAKGKWTELENLHFTYKFLGNVEEEKIDDIKGSLDKITGEYDSYFNIKGIGAFPLNDQQNPRILYAKVFNRDRSVFGFFNMIENEMEKLGFPRERKKFLPHVTLMRIKELNKDRFRETLEAHKDTAIGIMTSYKIRLVDSKLTNEGPIYSAIDGLDNETPESDTPA
jgi:2'-5' RNA ligase